MDSSEAKKDKAMKLFNEAWDDRQRELFDFQSE